MTKVFFLNIVMDNQAFADGNSGYEVARILEDVASDIKFADITKQTEMFPFNLLDINGNIVGFASVEEGIMTKPTIEELMEWESEGGCMATDGCWVEPDGVCEHGKPSWLIVMGLI